MSRKRWEAGVFLSVFFLSGFAGLGYEMVWTRMLSVGLGHEAVSIFAVMASLFCGISLGGRLLDGTVSRCSSPGRLYALLELAMGAWSLALVRLIPTFNGLASTHMGTEPGPLAHWTLSFLFPLLLLMPATFAMGGTIPAMERLLSARLNKVRCVGGIYAANTFGAVAGTLAGTFWLAPRLGFSTTLHVLAAINMLCGAGVLAATIRHEPDTSGSAPPSRLQAPARRLLISLFLTGLSGIGYEVLVIRVLSQVLESTVFSFTAVLAVYLFGTALGNALYQWLGPPGDFNRALTRLLALTSTACLVGIPVLGHSERIYDHAVALAGGGFWGCILGELALGAVVFLPPTATMGATFAHLAQEIRARGGGLGMAVSANAMGAAVAPPLFGVLLLPLLGSKAALVLTASSYLLIMPELRLSRLPPLAAPAALALAIQMSPLSLTIVTLGHGEKVVKHVEGVTAAVSVVHDDMGEYHLKVDNKFQMGGTSSYYSDRRQGHIPLLLHPDPKSALYLGLGTGATFAAAADHGGLEADGVELVPEIIPLMGYFEKSTGNFSRHERLHLKIADARRYVTACGRPYDVVVADLFHPARDGAGSLYTIEHFQAIRSLLAPGGVFCQWLPVYQLDEEMLRVIIRTFLRAFPDGTAYLAHYSLKSPILGLVGGNGPSRRYAGDWLSSRVKDQELSRGLRELRIEDSYSLLGCFVASSRDLAAFAGEGRINTDDCPVVTFEAPRFVYSATKSPAHARLMAMIDRFNPGPEDILEAATTKEAEETHRRLASYWTARNRFLLAGIGAPETGDVRQLVKHTRESLLAVVRASPDFSPAYNPLLAMAVHLYDVDRDASKSLLLDLEKANPERAEAHHYRERLFSR